MTLEEGVQNAVRQVVREEIRAALQEFVSAKSPEPVRESNALLTVEQVATQCGNATVETVRGWIHSKKLTAHKPGHRFLVHPDDLKRFLAEASPGEKKAVDSDEHLSKVLSRINRARLR